MTIAVLAEIDAMEAHGEQSDAAPRVEPPMEQPQLRLVRRHQREPDGGAEEAGATVDSRHSMTRSALSSSDGGMVRPSALAVSMERSPGFAPFRIAP